jgi:3'(2'), 5'-bisphosphate nucleotidase
MNNWDQSYDVAIQAAIDASAAIMRVYATDFSPEFKQDGSPVTIADQLSSEMIHRALSSTPFPITGEEVAKQPFSERKNWEKSWCVDPLDGTKEFVRKNGEFVVNIALIEQGIPVFGVIASPVARQVIAGGLDMGAFQFSFDVAYEKKHWKELPALHQLNSPLVMISSRSHFSGNLLSLVQRLEQQFGPIAAAKMGSALKFFDLVNGKADVYPRFAPTMEWDIAAGHAIYRAIGGEVVHSSTLQPLRYNKEDLYNPEFIAFNAVCLQVKDVFGQSEKG